MAWQNLIIFDNFSEIIMANFYKIVNLIVGLLPPNIPFSGPFSQKKPYLGMGSRCF